MDGLGPSDTEYLRPRGLSYIYVYIFRASAAGTRPGSHDCTTYICACSAASRERARAIENRLAVNPN